MAAPDDVDTLARTIYGEARGEGAQGQIAIANVVMNRIKSGITWWGDDVQSVCKKPFQFSCWNKNDPNLQVITDIQAGVVFDQCKEIAENAIDGILTDNTYGATSYYAKNMPAPPPWSIGKTPCAMVGNHIFFDNV